jgi:3',5'-cyclic AMP phosphodiesterase CpdA
MLRSLILISSLMTCNLGLAKDIHQIPQEGCRVVVFGDIHGDFNQWRLALQELNIIDHGLNWIADKTILVQAGDQTDRGVADGERRTLDLLASLKIQAASRSDCSGVHAVLGNHEIFNLKYYFRDVTKPEGFEAFSDYSSFEINTSREQAELSFGSKFPEDYDMYQVRAKGRMFAFSPEGPYGRILKDFPLAIMVGKNIIVHGGLRAGFIDFGIERANRNIKDWISGEHSSEVSKTLELLSSDDSPVWDRSFGKNEDSFLCEELKSSLARLGASRMIKGHDVQRLGVNSICDGMAWRVDIGLNQIAYGDYKQYRQKWQALQIDPDDNVKIIYSKFSNGYLEKK